MPRDLIVNGEVMLYGAVGGSWWDESGFSAEDVLSALASLDGDVTIRLNSGGGIAWEGIAIFNALKARADKVTIYIDGVAASAASVIAMGGDEIVMRTGALMMIHNASSITWGTADDHEQTIALLRKLDGAIASVYAERAQADLEEIRALMDAETWMTGAEAVEQGFATSTDDAKAAKAAAFDYRVYTHAPKKLLNLARPPKAGAPAPVNALRGPRPDPVSPAAAAANPEAPMPNANPAADPAPVDVNKAVADALAADRARRKSVHALENAQGREPLAEHLLETTDMSVAAIDAALAAAPKAQAESPAAHAARRAAAGGLAAPSAPDNIDPPEQGAASARILANYHAVTGFGPASRKSA